MDEKASLEEEAARYFSDIDDRIPAPRPDLLQQTMTRVHGEVIGRDLLEFFSSVFFLGCCVPLIGVFYGGVFVIEEKNDE